MDRIVVEVIGQSQGLEEANAKLKELEKTERDLIAKMKELERQKKQWPESAKAVGEYNKKISETKKEIQQARKSIDDLSKAQKEMPGKIVAENMTKSFRTIKRELQDQINGWSDWSEAGTKAFNELIAKTGELTDLMGDNQSMINYMASDTKVFDTLVEGTQAAAGGFSVLQGTMALFGSENEDVQRLMVKLQAAIAITTGLQQIQNITQKESNLMMGISIVQTKAKTAAEALSTKGTVAATVAQKALNIVAAMNPYVILATALITVVGALYIFSQSSKKAEIDTRNFNNEVERLNKSLSIQALNLEREADVYEKITGDRLGAIKKMQDGAQKSIEEYDRKLDAFFNKFGGDSSKYTKEQMSLYKKLNDEREKHSEKLESLFYSERLLRIENQNKEYEDQKAAGEREAQERNAAGERAKQIQEQRNNEILAAERSLTDEKIRAMQDGEEKEIAAIQNTMKNRIAEIKGNSQSEIDLRVQIAENANTEEIKVRKKYQDERDRIEIEAAISTTNTYLNEVEKGSEAELELKKQLLEEQAKLDLLNIENSIENENLKAAKIREVNTKLALDKSEIDNEYAERQKSILDKQLETEKEYADKRKELYRELADYATETFKMYLDFVYEGEAARYQKQLDNLQKYYTTSEEEAKNNKEKEYLSKEEYAHREEELQNKVREAEKKGKRAQVISSAAESTAKVLMKVAEIKAIASVLASNPATLPFVPMALSQIPLVLAQIPFIAAQSAIQLAAVNKYWKGRKGGKGEFAMVGEYGPELMWIPNMASIMPNRDTQKALAGNVDVFDRWDMPRMNNNIPSISQNVINQYKHENGMRIDYDLLAKKIGENVGRSVKIPKQNHTTVNIDRNGIYVEDGNTTTNVLNSRYNHN